MTTTTSRCGTASTSFRQVCCATQTPPLVLTLEGGSVNCVPLVGNSIPLGMFADSEFIAESHVVPTGAQILLYSDGVLGDPPQMAEFKALCVEFAAGPSLWLDELIDELPTSEDDCSLVLLTFPGVPTLAGGAAGGASAPSATLPR